MKKKRDYLFVILPLLAFVIASALLISKTGYTAESFNEWVENLHDEVGIRYVEENREWGLNDEKIVKPLLRVLSEIPKSVCSIGDGYSQMPSEKEYIEVFDKEGKTLVRIYSETELMPCNFNCVFSDGSSISGVWTYNTETPILGLLGPLIVKMVENDCYGSYRTISDV